MLGTGRYVPRAVFVDLEPTVIGKYIFYYYFNKVFNRLFQMKLVEENMLNYFILNN